MTDEQISINIRAAIMASAVVIILGATIGIFIVYAITGILVTILHINYEYTGLCMIPIALILCAIPWWFVYQIAKAFLSQD
jgi:hypothetical protein